MKKNNGFTLIELLAAIIILVAIALVAFPILLNTIKNSENQIDETTIKLVENAAKLYVDNKANDYPKQNGNTYCIPVSKLIEEKHLEKGILDAANVDSTDKVVKVTVTDDYDYEIVNNNQCQNDIKICHAVTEATKTTGNVPQGNYEVGDEYICMVKPTAYYHFFVLSKDGDNVNLILDRNINSDGTLATEGIEKTNNNVYNLTAWINLDDFLTSGGISDNFAESEKDINAKNNQYGPITAMKFLKNATNDWENISVIETTYNDLNGHYHNFEIKSRARLPRISEVENTGCYVIDPSSFEDYKNYTGTCPLWIVNYLHDFNDTLQEGQTLPGYVGMTFVNNIFGYWIMDSYKNDGFSTRNNDNMGYTETSACATDSWYGVRPVISVNKSQIK